MSDRDGAVDPAALDRLLEMTGGDPAFVHELVETFLEDAAVQLDAIGAAANTGSTAAMVRPAHSLKGNSASMGAERLAEMCRQLEADARAGMVDRATERVAEAAAEFERVRDDLLKLGGK